MRYIQIHRCFTLKFTKSKYGSNINLKIKFVLNIYTNRPNCFCVGKHLLLTVIYICAVGLVFCVTVLIKNPFVMDRSPENNDLPWKYWHNAKHNRTSFALRHKWFILQWVTVLHRRLDFLAPSLLSLYTKTLYLNVCCNINSHNYSY